jgi:hypothetical protein
VPVLRTDRPEPQTLLGALAELHTRGVAVDWRPALPAGGHVPLPTYRFQHQPYWLPDVAAEQPADEPFWAAVERGDGDGLAAILDVGEDQRRAITDLLPALSDWRRSRDWTYRVEWQPWHNPPAPVLHGTWVVLTDAGEDDTETAVRCAAAVTEHGGRVVMNDRVAGAAGIISLRSGDRRPDIDAPLWTVTRDPVWSTGLTRPDRVIAVPAEWDAGTGAALASVLAGGTEDQVAIRPGGLFVRRLARAVVPDEVAPPPEVGAADAAGRVGDGTVLVLGAAPLASQPPVHVADAVDPDAWRDVSPAAVVVLAPDLAAAADEFARERGVTAFVLVGALDDPDGYGRLEAIARARRAAGLPAVTVALGAWGSTAAPTPGPVQVMRARPVLGLLARIARCPEADWVVADVDWNAVREPGALVRDLVTHQGTPEPPGEDAAAWRKRFAAGSETEQVALVLDLIRTHAAVVLGYESLDQVNPEHTFVEIGFSSFSALELYNRLAAVAERDIPPLAIYDHPTPSSLARYVRDELASGFDETRSAS